jgi:hypothetical protein
MTLPVTKLSHFKPDKITVANLDQNVAILFKNVQFFVQKELHLRTIRAAFGENTAWPLTALAFD